MVLSLVSAILIGLGATLLTDLWAWVLKRVFKTNPPDYCLVGRWLRTMPEGRFRHSTIGSAPRKSAECSVGWIAHYLIGVIFAIAFVGLAGSHWLQHPTPISPLLFGVVTVLAPFLIMQPAFGLGVAAAKTPNPGQARLRSLMNHTVFGLGLYLFGWLARWLL
ncbi:MAG TPA: DUF2938 domain-containing protein [Anaerolineales bacterium]|jgi:hypothetical protein|nr:DUF2938 domain-containing protein [Anaerolineales bacterium]